MGLAAGAVSILSCNRSPSAPAAPIVGEYNAVRIDSKALPAGIGPSGDTSLVLVAATFTARPNGTFTVLKTVRDSASTTSSRVIQMSGKYSGARYEYVLSTDLGAPAGIASLERDNLGVALFESDSTPSSATKYHFVRTRPVP